MHILNNLPHFEKSQKDPYKNMLLLEDKVLYTIYLTEEEYKCFSASGCNRGVLYGLPKIHRANSPKTVLSSINTLTFNFAKFMIPNIEEWTNNEDTIDNSYAFFNVLKSFKLEKQISIW